MSKILEILFRHKDEKYRDFLSKIVNNIPKEDIIGIRSPEMKKIRKEIKTEAENEIPEFLLSLPHKYQEENYLHCIFLSEIKDFDKLIPQFEAFLPYITNWAVSDGMNPPAFSNNRQKLISYIEKWIQSDEPYTNRIAMIFLLKYYMDEDFNSVYLEWAASIRSDEYYVNMMTAWLFAEALAHQWEPTVKFLQENKLDVWTHNKAIQKARESRKITDEQKEYLKSLKRKEK